MSIPSKINLIYLLFLLSFFIIIKDNSIDSLYTSINLQNEEIDFDSVICKEEEYYDNITKECITKCEDNKYYYINGCVDECPKYWAFNESERICRNCSNISQETIYYFEENKCVSQCKQASKKASNQNICFLCTGSDKYYSHGGCVSSCPEYSITNKKDELCTYCPDDQNYFNNKCVNKCEEPYIRVLKEYFTNICQECANNTWYISGDCQENCGPNTYHLEEDKACHFCFCNDNGECNSSYICKCNNNFFGDSCELYYKESGDLEIISLNNKVLKTDVTFFGFNLINKNKFRKIKWDFSINSKELTSNPKYKKYFVTGNKEEIFGINPYLLSENYKKMTLGLTVIDNENIKYQNETRIYIQNIDIGTGHKVDFIDQKYQDSLDLYIPMNTTIEIEQIEYSNSDQYKYYYKFSFLDENNEELPLSNFIHQRSLITYYIPFAKQYIVTLKNDRGEIIKSDIKNKDSDVFKAMNITKFKTKSIEEIKNDDNYNDIEKMFIFRVIFNYNESFINQINTVFEYINNSYDQFLNEKGFYEIHKNGTIICYSEPKVLFSLINSIIINFSDNQKNNFNYSVIETILYSLKKGIDLLNKKNNIKLSKEDIISLIRTLEQLYKAYNEKIDEIKKENRDKFLSYFYYFLNQINIYLSRKLYLGEGIKIIGNRIILFSYHFGKYDELLSISSSNLTSQVNISNISTYSYEDYGLNEGDSINSTETFLYINQQIYEQVKKELNIKENTNLALNIYIVNNIKNNDNNNDEKDNYLVNFQFYDLNTGNNSSNITLKEDLLYSIKFSYKNEKKKTSFAQRENTNDKFYVPYNYSNVFCYPKNYKEDKDHFCFTFFDYKNDIIQCKCNVIDEISIIEDEKLANFYKSLQFKSVKYTYTNKVTKGFIILFLIFLLIPGLLFLSYDIYKANKFINKNEGLSFIEKRKEYYNDVKVYTDTKYSFPFYSVFNKFPYCQAFNPTYYTSPKFMRHLIVVTAILFGFILNLIPFFFYIPFEEKQNLIDKRDMNDNQENIHSIEIIPKYLYRGFISALISLILVHLFIKLFNKIVKIDEKNVNYWKNVKDICKDYIFFTIKKNRSLGRNFGRIRNRMRALYALCGRYLLNKNIMNHPARNKKLENYLKYTGKLNKINILNSKDKIEINNLSNNEEKEPLLYELPKNNDSINEEEKNIINTGYNPPKMNIKINIQIDMNSVFSSSFGLNKKIKIRDSVQKLKIFKSDNFQITKIIDNNKFEISKNSISRFEKIKNKYLNSNKFFKFNFSKSKKEINNDNKDIESPLCIYHNNNISIYNTEEYKNSNLEGNEVSDSGNDYKLLVIMSFVLGFLFFTLLLISIIMIKKLINEFEYFMVKIWIFCTILILFVFYFLIHLIKIIIASILLFNSYHSRKKGCFTKLMFKIFVDKSMIYMFKVRNYITKYKREFINI